MSEDGPPQLRLDGFDEVIVDPDRNCWTTPSYITEAAGEFDLDPASNPRSTVKAKRAFMLENGEDGLALARFVGPKTKLWLNPPYGPGEVIKWVRAYRHTRFCFLIRLDPSTDWWYELSPKVDVICTPFNQRIQFVPPPGAVASSASAVHSLLYAREEDVTEAIRSMCYVWKIDHRPFDLVRLLFAPLDSLTPVELQRRFEYEEAEATQAMERAAATREALRQLGT